MKQRLIRTYTLLLIINLSHCYTIPSADFVIYPKGFSVSIPDEPGIEVFFFYGSVDTVTCNFQTNSIIMSTSKTNGEKWVLENTNVTLLPGQTLFYWIYVKKDGVDYTKHDNFYNVTDIYPYSSTTTVPIEEANVINNSTVIVTTKPRLNLDPYHLKPSKIVTPVSIVAKSPFTQGPQFHVDQQITAPVFTKPRLNLDPYQHKEASTSISNKIPFSQVVNSQTSEIPDFDGNTQNLYVNLSPMNTTSERKCSTLLDEETGTEPPHLPLETNQNNSKDANEPCKLDHIASKFNSNNPPVLTQKWKGQDQGQTTTAPTKIRPIGDIWYWNRK